MIAMRYNRTNAEQQLENGTDTLRVLFKGAREEARQKEQAEKDWEKRVKRAEKKGEDIDSIKAAMDAEEEKKRALKINVTSGSVQEVYAPIYLKFTTPLDTIHLDKLHLEVQVDSVVGHNHNASHRARRLFRTGGLQNGVQMGARRKNTALPPIPERLQTSITMSTANFPMN